MHIDRPTGASLLRMTAWPVGRRDRARGAADNRFRRIAVDGPLLSDGALGPDGRLWFNRGRSMFRSDTAGAVTETS